MKPNNHILFNFINNIIFHTAVDKTATGRIISLVCYWGLIPVFYYWLKPLFQQKWLAILVTFTMAVQFPVWGFSFQARGYELLVLAEWCAFISFFRYHFSENDSWLKIHVASCCIAYFCMPTFLYLHLCILVFAFLYQLINKKINYLFWKYQLSAFAIVFLLYLPCLCFSGANAITANEYVTSDVGIAGLIDALPLNFRSYTFYCFAWVVNENNIVDLALFLLPLLLLLFRNNKNAFFLGCFYVAMWVSCILLTGIMKVYPVDRTLIGQISITLMLSLYTTYLLISLLAAKLNVKILPLIIFPLLPAVLSYNYITKGPQMAMFGLCHFPVNQWHDAVNYGLNHIPRGNSVAFSDECFYWHYLSKQQGYNGTMCAQGYENYFVRYYKDSLPAGAAQHYFPFKKLDDFTIYMRK